MLRRILALIAVCALPLVAGTIYDPVLGKLRSDVASTLPDGSAIGAGAEVVSDTTPQLGGNLDVNGKTITSASNGHIVLSPNGTGNVGIGVSTPTSKVHLQESAASAVAIKIDNLSSASGAGAQITLSTGDCSGELAVYSAATLGGARFNMTTDGYILLGATDRLDFYTANNLVARINALGNFGIGTGVPNDNAILDVVSTTKAFMPPRMTTAQRDAISSPAEGMVIFNTTTHTIDSYSGTAWAGGGSGDVKLDQTTPQTFTGGAPTFGAGLNSGLDVAGGTTNVPGWWKVWSNGDNAYYTTFTAGTQTQNCAYTLPVNDGDSGQALTTDGSGVLSWAGGGVFLAAGTQSGTSATASSTATASGNQSLALGYIANTAAADSVCIGSGSSATSGGTNAVVIGKNSSTTTANSVVVGAAGTASGADAIAIGTAAEATAAGSIAIGNNADAKTGDNTIAIGNWTSATSSHAIGMGVNSAASSSASVCIGYTATASVAATGAVAIGGSATLTQPYSIGIGYYAKPTRYGEFSINGDHVSGNKNPWGLVQWKAQTADATPVEIFLHGVNEQRCILAANTSFRFVMEIVAKQAATDNVATWKCEGLAINNGGTTTVVLDTGSPVTTALQGTVTGWLPAITAKTDTAEALIITVTGAAATTINWHATATLTEVKD